MFNLSKFNLGNYFSCAKLVAEKKCVFFSGTAFK